MRLNEVTKLREGLLPLYQQIKIYSKSNEHFVSDRSDHSYSWNDQE